MKPRTRLFLLLLAAIAIVVGLSTSALTKQAAELLGLGVAVLVLLSAPSKRWL